MRKGLSITNSSWCLYFFIAGVVGISLPFILADLSNLGNCFEIGQMFGGFEEGAANSGEKYD